MDKKMKHSRWVESDIKVQQIRQAKYERARLKEDAIKVLRDARDKRQAADSAERKARAQEMKAARLKAKSVRNSKGLGHR